MCWTLNVDPRRSRKLHWVFTNRIIFLQPRTFCCQLTLTIWHYHNDRYFGPLSLNWSDDQRTSKIQKLWNASCPTYKKIDRWSCTFYVWRQTDGIEGTMWHGSTSNKCVIEKKRKWMQINKCWWNARTKRVIICSESKEEPKKICGHWWGRGEI